MAELSPDLAKTTETHKSQFRGTVLLHDTWMSPSTFQGGLQS